MNMFSQTHDELRIARAPWSPRAAKHIWSGSLTDSDIDIDTAWRYRFYLPRTSQNIGNA